METTLEKNRTQMTQIERIHTDLKISENLLNQLNQRSISFGKIVAISISKKKGIPKTNVQSAKFIETLELKEMFTPETCTDKLVFLHSKALGTGEKKVYRIFIPVHLLKT